MQRKFRPLAFARDGVNGQGWNFPELNPMSIAWLTEFVGNAKTSIGYLALTYNQANNYVKTQVRVDDSGDADWRWDAYRARRERTREELQALVPHVRRLAAHVNQVRDGGRTLDLQLVANVVAVLVGMFVIDADPEADDLPQRFMPVWEMPVSGWLMGYLAPQMRNAPEEVSPTFRRQLDRQSDFIHKFYKVTTLGAMRAQFQRTDRERKYLARDENDLMADFMRLSARLRETLPVEDFALLKKYGNLFEWHARIEENE